MNRLARNVVYAGLLSALSLAACAPCALADDTAASPLLAAQTPIEVPGGPGKFDWMAVDRGLHRILASHAGKGTLVVFDLGTREVRQLQAGEVNGEAVDEKDDLLATGGGGKTVTIFKRSTLEKVGEIALDGPADAIAFEPKSGNFYVDEDDGTRVWVIDPRTLKIAGAVTIAGAPEYLVYDGAARRFYQNIKTANCLQVIDPAKRKVVASWPTAPTNSPHGLAAGTNGRLYIAGKNILSVMDAKSGKILGSTEIAKGSVDQIDIDEAKGRVYCANSSGSISVVGITEDGAKLLGIVPSHKGSHTLAVDPDTHSVWICYSDDKGSYLQEYRPQ